jgi:hypothetical protein
MDYPPLEYIRTHTLTHHGDCALLAATADLSIYVEEMYGEGWLAQTAIAPDGSIIAAVDEDEGRSNGLQPLEIPENAIAPRSAWNTMALNFGGARHRGLRAAERIDELAHPLTITEKLALTTHLALKILPPHLLGLAESYVLAEAHIQAGLYVVCRRFRIVHVLPAAMHDTDQQPYDYDTLPFFVAHFYQLKQSPEPTLIDFLAHFSPLPHRPMDCLVVGDHIIVADGGDAQRTSAIHIWRMRNLPHVETEDERLWKKLYG